MSKNMENAAVMASDLVRFKFGRQFGLDSGLVLFFLAMDVGGGLGNFGLDVIISLLTLAAFITFSYFLPSPAQKPEIAVWIGFRLIVAVAGFMVAGGLKVLSELFLMQNIKYVPMTFLILTGILCAATQIRGIIRVRLAG